MQMYTYTGIGAGVFIPPLAGGMPGPGSGARYAVLPWPAQPFPSLADVGASVHDTELDLALPDAPARLINAAADACGHLDILVCNHARSGGDGPLGTLDAGLLDAHWAVNTRSSILLAQAFAGQHDGRPAGRIVFMTSGQDLGPMTGEVAYGRAGRYRPA